MIWPGHDLAWEEYEDGARWMRANGYVWDQAQTGYHRLGDNPENYWLTSQRQRDKKHRILRVEAKP